jgi:hypothetical protein
MADRIDRIEEAARAMWIEWGGTKETWETVAQHPMVEGKPSIAELYRRGARACEAVLREDGLRKAAHDLAVALENCEKAINGAFQFAGIHGIDYTDGGKLTYGKELDAVKRVLQNLPPALSSPLHQAEPAKFGHHPDALIDAQVEVDRLRGHLKTAETVLSDVLSLDVATANGQRVKNNVRWAIGEIYGDEKMKAVAPKPAPSGVVERAAGKGE